MKLSRSLRIITNRLKLTKPGIGIRPLFSHSRVPITPMSDAIRSNDQNTIRAEFERNPNHRTGRTPFAGGTWLHFAASSGTPDVVQLLIDLGMDVNQPGFQEGELAICRAIDSDRSDNAKVLLDSGSRLDTSKSVRNPLFAAIVGGSEQGVRMLLSAGIDASVRYNSSTMRNTDAMSFAIFRGRHYGARITRLAEIISDHLAEGDEALAQNLLDDARHRDADW